MMMMMMKTLDSMMMIEKYTQTHTPRTNEINNIQLMDGMNSD